MYGIQQFSWHCLKGDSINDLGAIQSQKDILSLGNGYHTVIQLGIQAPPGTMFTINAGNSDIANKIEIGETGIFELDFKESNTYITTLYLSVPAYLINDQNKATKNFDVIIDILYEH